MGRNAFKRLSLLAQTQYLRERHARRAVRNHASAVKRLKAAGWREDSRREDEAAVDVFLRIPGDMGGYIDIRIRVAKKSGAIDCHLNHEDQGFFRMDSQFWTMVGILHDCEVGEIGAMDVQRTRPNRPARSFH